MYLPAGPVVSRSRSYKKERKRTLETFSEKPTHSPKLKLTNVPLPIPRDPESKKVRSYKKKEERTLVTFLKKPTHSPKKLIISNVKFPEIRSRNP
jgi:hypothetical protein